MSDVDPHTTSHEHYTGTGTTLAGTTNILVTAEEYLVLEDEQSQYKLHSEHKYHNNHNEHE